MKLDLRPGHVLQALCVPAGWPRVRRGQAFVVLSVRDGLAGYSARLNLGGGELLETTGTTDVGAFDAAEWRVIARLDPAYLAELVAAEAPFAWAEGATA